MAQSTPLRPLATLDAVTFRFPIAPAVDVIVSFYDVAGVHIPGSAGTIDITASRPMTSYAGTVSEPTILPEIEAQPIIPTQTCVENNIYTISLGGNGSGVLKLTPSNIVPPGGGIFYTIKIDVAQKHAPEPLT